MATSRSGSVPTWWGAMTAREKGSSTQVEKSAVEKAGAWKPAKTKSRFSPAPTLPWKSRTNREIPTFPPRRRRLLFYPKEKQRPKPKPKKRRPEGRIALFHKADRSLIIKTGQLDLLTTEAAGHAFLDRRNQAEHLAKRQALPDRPKAHSILSFAFASAIRLPSHVFWFVRAALLQRDDVID